MTLYTFTRAIITYILDLIVRPFNWLFGENNLITCLLHNSYFISISVYLTIAAAIIIITLLNTVILIWVERKLLGRFMDRRAAMHVGWAGILQNIADGIKLFLKEDIIHRRADKLIFIAAITLFTGSTLVLLATIPISPWFTVSPLNTSLLLALALFSLAPLCIFLAGWAANNKYTLIGGMRSAAQMIAYEIPLVLSVIGVVILAGSLNFADIVEAQKSAWFVIPQLLGFFIFITAMIAEVERIPFDLPEAEAELVEGWNTEYSGMKFGFVMVTEYIRGYAGCALAVLLFFGGWSGPVLPPVAWFFIKVYILFAVFVWVRASLPRVRIDQLLNISWKRLMPLAIINIFLAVAISMVGLF